MTRPRLTLSRSMQRKNVRFAPARILKRTDLTTITAQAMSGKSATIAADAAK